MVQFKTKPVLGGIVGDVQACPSGFQRIDVTKFELGVAGAAVDGISLELLCSGRVDLSDWAELSVFGGDGILRRQIGSGD